MPRRTQSTTSRPAPRPRRRKRYVIDFKRLAVNLLIFAFLCVLTFAALTSPRLSITRVRLVGVETIPTEEIQKRLDLQQGRNIFLINKQVMAAELLKNPVVKDVHIYRQLPSTIAVRVVERKPDLILHVGGKLYEVDDEGLPFRVAASLPADVSILTCMNSFRVNIGKPIKARQFTITRRCLLMAREKKILSVSEITIDQNSDLCLNVRDGFKVILGRPERLAEKLDKAARTAEEYPNTRRNWEYIDVTVPDVATYPKMKGDSPSH